MTKGPVVSVAFRVSLLSLVVCATFLSSARAQAEVAKPAAVPPIPKGFASTEEVMEAIGKGKLKLVNLTPAVPQSVTVIRSIEYGKVGDRSLQLDLYQPKGLERPVPGLILIHGGAWGGGNRQVLSYYCVKLAERGYVASTISYRLSGEKPYPAAVQDAKCAVRWMRANAGKYHVDPSKIGVMGNSAGGHLALMVAYTPDVPGLEGQGGHPDTSSRVQAVINFYGPTDLTTAFSRKQSAVVGFMGGKPYDQASDQYKEASPLTHLSEDDPPTITLHGTIDDLVPIAQADALDAKLKQLGIPHVYERFEGWPHVMDAAEEVNQRCLWSIGRFLEEHLPLPKDDTR